MEERRFFVKRERKPRNVWSHNEVVCFLDLLKARYNLDFNCEKKRKSFNFEALVTPMRQAGFMRNCLQMKIKFKNLKCEYYACKKNNSVYNNDWKVFEYYQQLDDLLGTNAETQAYLNTKIEVTTLDILDQNDSYEETPKIEFEPTNVSSITSTSSNPAIEKSGTSQQDHVYKEQSVDLSVKSFCDSLYNDLKNVPKQNLIKCKIQILETVEKFKRNLL